jgi:hypothetical protein
MGRTDAVAFVLECVLEWRALGATVEFELGWEARGNGTSADYEGGLVHHTAAASSQARPFPSRTVLLQGRPDLGPPLCNVAGPWCPIDRPLLRVMAANPANHAGASGGRSMGPLPTSGLFNKRVLGLEIDYAGIAPMSPGQYRAAVIFGAGVTRVLKRPSAEWIRGHRDTSITGKWDPGFAPPDRTIDLAAYRRDAWALATTPTTSEEDQLVAALSEADAKRLVEQVNAMSAGMALLVQQASGDEDGPGPDGWGWPTLRHDGGPDLTIVDLLRHIDRETNSRLGLDGRPGPGVDTLLGHVLSMRAEIAALRGDVVSRLAKLAQAGGLPAAVAETDPATLAAIAAAVADEQDRRTRKRLAPQPA